MNRNRSQNRAVSPVIAVILMVAVTVVLSAAIGAFVFNLGQSTTDRQSQQLGVSTSKSNGIYTAQVITGEADELQILVNGEIDANITNPSPGDEASVIVGSNDQITIVRVDDGEKKVLQRQTLDDTAGPTPPTQNLLSYWKFDDSSTSAVAVDSEDSRNGDIVGAEYIDGRVGSNALYSNGSEEVVVPHDSYLEAKSGSISWFAWAKAKTLDNGRIFHMSKAEGDASRPTQQLLITSGGRVSAYIQDSSNTSNAKSSSTISTNEWYHVGFVWNGTTDTLYVYVNGQLEQTSSSATIGTVAPQSDLHIAGTAFSSSYFNGSVDDVRVYDSPLSHESVERLYDATK